MHIRSITAGLFVLALCSTASAEINYQPTAATLYDLRMQARQVYLEHHWANQIIQSDLSQENEDNAGNLMVLFWFYYPLVDECEARAAYQDLADNAMTAGAYEASLKMVDMLSYWCPPRRAVARSYVLTRK